MTKEDIIYYSEGKNVHFRMFLVRIFRWNIKVRDKNIIKVFIGLLEENV